MPVVHLKLLNVKQRIVYKDTKSFNTALTLSANLFIVQHRKFIFIFF